MLAHWRERYNTASQGPASASALGQGEVAVLLPIRAVRDNCRLNDPRSRTSYDAEYRRHGRAAEAAFVPPPAPIPKTKRRGGPKSSGCFIADARPLPINRAWAFASSKLAWNIEGALEFSLWYLRRPVIRSVRCRPSIVRQTSQ